jgi:hypothetical protein
MQNDQGSKQNTNAQYTPEDSVCTNWMVKYAYFNTADFWRKRQNPLKCYPKLWKFNRNPKNNTEKHTPEDLLKIHKLWISRVLIGSTPRSKYNLLLVSWHPDRSGPCPCMPAQPQWHGSAHAPWCLCNGGARSRRYDVEKGQPCLLDLEGSSHPLILQSKHLWIWDWPVPSPMAPFNQTHRWLI